MKLGKLIVIEGIYGSGKLVVDLVAKLRERLESQGREVYEIDSPDSGRAQLMGAPELDSGWRYGIFKSDFFFELASRARACAVIRQALDCGKIVICKNFTISSMAYAQLKGHDWFREDLNCLEARARGLQFGGEVAPDLTIFLDVQPETSIDLLGVKLLSYFKPSDLFLQQKIFLEELSKLPSSKVLILNAERHQDDIFSDSLSVIRKVIE